MSSGEDDTEKSGSVRYVKFSGKGSEFNEWKVKVLALARRKNFGQYLKEDRSKDANFEKGNADALDQLVLILTGIQFDLIQEAEENAYRAWNILLNKYEVSDEKSESLTDVTMEWNQCKVEGTEDDPDTWFSCLYRINQKFKKINVLYEKDDECMKAHVLANLPEEYKHVRTNLYMNTDFTYEEYRKHIRHFWYTELGGKEYLRTGKSNVKISEGETALNTTTFNGQVNTGFPYKCQKCGKKGHKAKDCKAKPNERVRFTGTCNWCGKQGHKEKYCFAKKRGELRSAGNKANGNEMANSTESTDNTEEMFAGMVYCQEIKETSQVEEGTEEWLGDSEATAHITNSNLGMTNTRDCKVPVTVSTGEVTVATTIGDVTLISMKGEKVKLLNVLHVPSAKRNLLSTNRFTQAGAEMYVDKEKMIIKKGSRILTLKSTGYGSNRMYYLHGKRVGHELHDVASSGTENLTTEEKALKSMDINKAHGLCHLGKKLLRITYKNLNMKLTGTLLPCDGCCRANAKAKGVNKRTMTVATKIGERLFVDTRGPYPETVNGNKYWICMVDDMTRKSCSKFKQSKAEMPKIVEEHVEYLRGCGHEVKFIRCDNAGEHQSNLQKVCEKHGIQLEYTAPHTPQLNKVVERRITVLLNWARAFLYAANLTEEYRKKLWAEAVNCTEDV